MDSMVLARKIDSILRCLNRIEQRLPKTEADFFQDIDAQDVLVLNLTRAIQISMDIAAHIIACNNDVIPSSMAETFVSLQRLNIITPEIADTMRRSVSFRNVAVHAYDEIDLKITYAIASHHLNDFKQYIEQVIRDNEDL